MTARSHRLGYGALAAGDTPVVYTCPVGSVALVKVITFDDVGGEPINASAHLDIAGMPVTFWHVVTAGEYETVVWDHTVVMEAGDVLYVACDSGGPLYFQVSGAVLEA